MNPRNWIEETKGVRLRRSRVEDLCSVVEEQRRSSPHSVVGKKVLWGILLLGVLLSMSSPLFSFFFYFSIF